MTNILRQLAPLVLICLGCAGLAQAQSVRNDSYNYRCRDDENSHRQIREFGSVANPSEVKEREIEPLHEKADPADPDIPPPFCGQDCYPCYVDRCCFCSYLCGPYDTDQRNCLDYGCYGCDPCERSVLLTGNDAIGVCAGCGYRESICPPARRFHVARRSDLDFGSSLID